MLKVVERKHLKSFNKMTKNTIKASSLSNFSMGYPVGLLQGTLKQKNMMISTSTNHLLSLQCCYIAFGHTFLESVLTWTPDTIDKFLIHATQLYEDSVRKESFDTLHEDQIPSKFQWANYHIEMKLRNESMMGIINSNDRTVKNLYNGLKTFFKKSKAGILTCRKKCYLVWQDTSAHYILDLQGRRNDVTVDTCRGLISVLCFETINNMAFFLMNLSNLCPNDPFALSTLQMQAMAKVSQLPTTIMDTVPVNKWRVLDNHRGILCGSLNVKIDCFEPYANSLALTSCCMAIVYTWMSPPNSWNGRIIDKIILLGYRLLMDCLKFHKTKQFLLDQMLKTYTIGPYTIDIEINQNVANGQIRYAINYKQTELHLALTNYFHENGKCVLIEAGAMTFLIWQNDGLFYLFDPYDRNSMGHVTEKSLGRSCLQMHSTLDSLCSIFIENLHKVAAKKLFQLHNLSVAVQCGKCGGKNSVLIPHCTEDCDEKLIVLNESIHDLYLPNIKCLVTPLTANESASEFESIQSMASYGEDSSSQDEEFDIAMGYGARFARAFKIDGSKVMSEKLTFLIITVRDRGICSGNLETLCKEQEAKDDEPCNNIFGLPNDQYIKLKELDVTDSQIFAFQALDLNTYYMIRWTKLGLKPDDVQILKQYLVSAKEYEAYAKHGFTVFDIKAIKEFQLNPKDYIRLRKENIPPEQMNSALQHEHEINQYKELKLNLCEMKRLFDLNIRPEEYQDLVVNGLGFEDIVYMKENNISHGHYLELKQHGLTIADIDKIQKNSLDPKEYIAGRTNGMSLIDIVSNRDIGYPAEHYVTLKNIGLTPDDMKRLKELNVSVEEFQILSKIGVDIEEAGIIVSQGLRAEEYVDWKHQGLQLQDMIDLKSKEMTQSLLGDTQSAGLQGGSESGVPLKGISPQQMPLNGPHQSVAPQGVFPSGTAQQGVLPLSTAPQGVLAPGTGPQGVLLPGTAPQGVLPLGTAPQGVLSPGTTAQGVLPLGAAPQGVLLPDKEPQVAHFTGAPVSGGISPGVIVPKILPPTQEILSLQGVISPAIVPLGISLQNGTSTSQGANTQVGFPSGFIPKYDYVQTNQLPSEYGQSGFPQNGYVQDGYPDGQSFNYNDNSSEDSCEQMLRLRKPTTRPSSPSTVSEKKNLAVVASSSGTPKSIFKLLSTSFKMVDRVLVMTSWGDFVVFHYQGIFSLYEGCACNLDAIRRLDVSQKSPDLLQFDKLESLILRIIEKRSTEIVRAGHCNSLEQVIEPRDINKPTKCADRLVTCDDKIIEESHRDVKVQYALGIIGKKIEKMSQEASTILDNFRAVQNGDIL